LTAKVSYFSGYNALEEVNEFLAENAYEVQDVHVQFVRTSVQTGSGDVFGDVEESTEAYVTHPA
jgi:hypothetical protein